MPQLTYEEATELAFFGATVLHPSAMQPALQFNNMGVRVKNSYNMWAPRPPMFLPPRVDSTLSPFCPAFASVNEANPACKVSAKYIGSKPSAGGNQGCPTMVAV